MWTRSERVRRGARPLGEHAEVQASTRTTTQLITAVARLITAVVLTALLARPAAGAESPRAVVEATAGDVIAVLADTGLSSDQKRQRVEEIVYRRVDFETLSRLVLARAWNQLNDAQRAEFMEEFKKHLSLTYGRNVDRYKNQRLRVISDRKESQGDWTVKTTILGTGSEAVAVDYRLRQRDGEWHIIDVIIEGVGLVSNFRSQFQQIMASGGAEKLLDVLRQKNARGEPLKT